MSDSQNVDIILSFDDGPHHASGSANRTMRVLNTLENNPTAPGINAVFFIQTHDKDENNNYRRGMSTHGKATLLVALERGHLVQVHTGMDGQNAHDYTHIQRHNAGELVNDLNRAKEFIEGLDDGDGDPNTHHEVEFVRPVGGSYNEDVINDYNTVDLKCTIWNVDPRDWDDNRTPDQIAQDIYDQVNNLVAGGHRLIVILLHDLEGNTYPRANLEKYIDRADQAVKDENKIPVWVHTEARIRTLLKNKRWTNYPNH